MVLGDKILEIVCDLVIGAFADIDLGYVSYAVLLEGSQLELSVKGEPLDHLVVDGLDGDQLSAPQLYPLYRLLVMYQLIAVVGRDDAPLAVDDLKVYIYAVLKVEDGLVQIYTVIRVVGIREHELLEPIGFYRKKDHV